MGTKLSRRWHMISTQISLLFDWFRTDLSIKYPSVLQIYRDSIQLTSYVHPYMPLSILYLAFPLFLLLLRSLQPEHWVFDYSIPWHCQYYSRSKLRSSDSITFNQRAVAKLRFFLPAFLARIWARPDRLHPFKCVQDVITRDKLIILY